MTKAKAGDGTRTRGKKAKQPTICAILGLEERLEDPELGEQKSAELYSQMEEMLRQFDDPDFERPLLPDGLPSGGIIGTFRRRNRSALQYCNWLAERNRIVARLGEVSALNQKRNLDKNPRDIKLIKIRNRNKQMAQRYLERKNYPWEDKSNTAIMEEIGKSHGLSRTAAIDAIKSGLKLLENDS
jgi:hypothetical protein